MNPLQSLQPLLRRGRANLARLGAACLLAACGGGDGGIDGTGATATGMSYGTITAFGSVWVNGVRFDTSSATFKRDDNTVTQSDLRVGMVVRVDGSIDDTSTGGRALTVTVDDAIKGRVEQVLDASRMVVMGQTVQIDNNTRFDNGVVPAVNDYVEVHGTVVGDGTLSAGYIEKKAALATPPFVVKGLVKNHDTAGRSFQVGTLRVNYGAAIVDDMPSGSWNGLTVDAKGSTCAGNPACGTLTASKVEPAGARVSNIGKAEVEGFVTSTTATGFVVAGQAVTVSASTSYQGGVAADVVAGVKLEAEGPIVNGVLAATKVSFRDNVRFEADVATVNAGAGTLTLAGLPGLTVQVTSLTELKGLSGLAALAAGNHLRIKARPGANNSVLAIELERRSADNRVLFEGPVSATSGTSTLTILGVVVDTTRVAESEFKDVSGPSLGRAAFFARLGTGGLAVKARGTLGAGNAVIWDQMEIED